MAGKVLNIKACSRILGRDTQNNTEICLNMEQ